MLFPDVLERLFQGSQFARDCAIFSTFYWNFNTKRHISKENQGKQWQSQIRRVLEVTEAQVSCGFLIVFTLRKILGLPETQNLELI